MDQQSKHLLPIGIDALCRGIGKKGIHISILSFLLFWLVSYHLYRSGVMYSSILITSAEAHILGSSILITSVEAYILGIYIAHEVVRDFNKGDKLSFENKVYMPIRYGLLAFYLCLILLSVFLSWAFSPLWQSFYLVPEVILTLPFILFMGFNGFCDGNVICPGIVRKIKKSGKAA